jgi:hypothetical protein
MKPRIYNLSSEGIGPDENATLIGNRKYFLEVVSQLYPSFLEDLKAIYAANEIALKNFAEEVYIDYWPFANLIAPRRLETRKGSRANYPNQAVRDERKIALHLARWARRYYLDDSCHDEDVIDDTLAKKDSKNEDQKTWRWVRGYAGQTLLTWASDDEFKYEWHAPGGHYNDVAQHIKSVEPNGDIKFKHDGLSGFSFDDFEFEKWSILSELLSDEPDLEASWKRFEQRLDDAYLLAKSETGHPFSHAKGRKNTHDFIQAKEKYKQDGKDWFDKRTKESVNKSLTRKNGTRLRDFTWTAIHAVFRRGSKVIAAAMVDLERKVDEQQNFVVVFGEQTIKTMESISSQAIEDAFNDVYKMLESERPRLASRPDDEQIASDNRFVSSLLTDFCKRVKNA